MKLFGLEKEHTYTNVEINGGFDVYYDGKPTGYQIMKYKDGYYIYKNNKKIKDAVFFHTLRSANMGVMIIHKNIGGVIFND